MKGKRGILMKNVLGIIIAVLGLSLIFYGAYRIYTANVNLEEKNVRNIIDSLEGKINLVQEGQEAKITTRGLEGWYLVGWNKSELSRPEKCFLKSCICICKNGGGLTKEDFTESCQQGFCRFFDFEGVYVSLLDSPIKPPTTSEETWSSQGVHYFNLTSIPLENNLIELDVKISESDISITSKYVN